MNSSGPRILDGKWLASLVQDQISSRVAQLSPTVGRPPGLGVILVGDNPASQTYVSNKERFAERCGVVTIDRKLPGTASDAQVQSVIEELNADEAVDGILLQLPLPHHLQANPLLSKIAPSKDADGLHPLNQGLLLRGEGVSRPCTPLGAMKLIDLAFSGVKVGDTTVKLEEIKPADLAGMTAVVIGRSILVGKPMALMLQERNATVVMAHSKTKNLNSITSQADLVVAAAGVAHLIKEDWVKEGAIVIDVGINRSAAGKITGDVDFEHVAAKCRAITPVPGGAGPMTIAMLIRNTMQNYLSVNKII